MSPYQLLIAERTVDRKVQDVAREWDVPAHVLYDALRNEAKGPSMKHAPKIAAAVGMELGEFLRRFSPQEVPA